MIKDKNESNERNGRAEMRSGFTASGIYYRLWLDQDSVRKTGVVIAMPVGKEYGTSFSENMVLGKEFAVGGFPVIILDFFGCGDSYGSFKEARVCRWKEDIAEVGALLRELVDIDKLVLIGRELSGLVCVDAIAATKNVFALVLWDVPPDGRFFLRDRRKRYKGYVQGTFSSVRIPRTYEDIEGYPYSKDLRRDIMALKGSIPLDMPNVLVLGRDSGNDMWRRKLSVIKRFDVQKQKSFPLLSVRLIYEWLNECI